MAVQIKFCGLTNPDSVEAAIALGADYVGLVHYEPSPRHLSLEAARALRDQAQGRIKTVLLLVNAQPAAISAALQAVMPDVVQFHGTEPPELLASVKRSRRLAVWKAFGLRDAAGLERSKAYYGAADCIIFDAPARTLPGGTGTRFDWNLLSNHRPAVPWGLAGGLDPTNVAAAIAATRAPLVDVSSGVESAPGVKDVDKMAAFIKAARP